MKKIVYSALVAVATLGLSSCYCNKIVVGNVSPNEELVHVKSVRTPHYLYGLGVNHDKASNHMQGIKDYVVETKTTFWDAVLGGVTFGLYTPNTTKYYVPKSNSKVVAGKQKFMSKAYEGSLK